MSDNKHSVIDFTVTADMVDAFARLSGDYNSMHVDPEIARKSRYRQPVVHGMIPFSFIQFLGCEFEGYDVEFVELSTRFRKPVFINDAISLEITCTNTENEKKYNAVWRNKAKNEILITSKGEFRLINQTNSANNNLDTFLVSEITEAQYHIDDLPNRREQLTFQATDSLKDNYVAKVFSPGMKNLSGKILPGNNLLAVLMLSTLVGMRLPGRYATFTRFDISFDTGLLSSDQYTLTGNVTKVSKATEIMEAVISIESEHPVASGKIEVMLNPPPKKMLSSQEVVKRYCHFDLNEKVALITGASRGIGETTAKLFAALGAKVVINYYRGKGDAEHIVDEIKASGGEAIAIQCDITDENSVKEMVKTALQTFKRIDILVNNAVKDFTPKNITEMEWDDFNQELEVSVKGMHACCREVIPIFKQNGGGKIINLSTVAVDNPVAGQSRYITAKSAVAGYTKSLAKELLKFNIQANLVVPNMTDTDLVSVIPGMYREKIAESRPYGRHVRPVEVAQSIAFLASNWSDAITGQKVVLNLGEPPFA